MLIDKKLRDEMLDVLGRFPDVVAAINDVTEPSLIGFFRPGEVKDDDVVIESDRARDFVARWYMGAAMTDPVLWAFSKAFAPSADRIVLVRRRLPPNHGRPEQRHV